MLPLASGATANISLASQPSSIASSTRDNKICQQFTIAQLSAACSREDVVRTPHSIKHLSLEQLSNVKPENAPGKIAHVENPSSCYIAVMLNTLNHPIFRSLFRKFTVHDTDEVKTLKKVIFPALEKLKAPPAEKFDGIDTGVVSTADIFNILSALKRYNIVGDQYQDPLEVFGKVIDRIQPNFSLCTVRESFHYEPGAQEASRPHHEDGFPNSHLKFVDIEKQSLKDTPEKVISVGTKTSHISLSDALKSYCEEISEDLQIYSSNVNRPNEYQFYLHAKSIRRRTFLTAPKLFILEVSGSFDATTNTSTLKGVKFSDRITITCADGNVHYYSLIQVNCHEVNHEYAYLKFKDRWFLSDDMRPIRKADFQQGSRDMDTMCRYGRSFIFEKVEHDTFAKLTDIEFSYSPKRDDQDWDKEEQRSLQNTLNSSPEALKNHDAGVTEDLMPSEFSMQTFSPNSQLIEGDIRYVVALQLNGLIQICESLSASKSLDDLIRLSWGIASLPKEMKFSAWTNVMTDRQWLLLEDIARQINQRFKNWPNLKSDEISSGATLITELLEDVSHIKFVLETIKARNANATESRIDLSDLAENEKIKPESLQGFERNFFVDFDGYILQRVSRYLGVINTVTTSFKLIDWLRDKDHIKALFRTLEVVGEATKILSKNTKNKIPTLNLDGGKGWITLRNKLHHRKKRSMQIAACYPEIFVYLMRVVLQQLEEEILHFRRQKGQVITGTKVDSKAESAVRMLIELCEEHQYIRVQARWKKSKFKEKFNSRPRNLKRMLLGLSLAEFPDSFRRIPDDFEAIWNREGAPHLKQSENRRRVCAKAHALFAIGRPHVLSEEDIRKLKIPPKRILDKADLVQRLKQLICSLSPMRDDCENTNIRTQYEELVNQLVILRDEDGKCDVAGYTQLKGLAERRLKVVNALRSPPLQTPFNQEMFLNQNGFQAPDGEKYQFSDKFDDYIKTREKAFRPSQVSDAKGTSTSMNLVEIQAKLAELIKYVQSKTVDTGLQLLGDLFSIRSKKAFNAILGDSSKVFGDYLADFKKHHAEYKGTDENRAKWVELIDKLKILLSKVDKETLSENLPNHGLDQAEKKLDELGEQIKSNQYTKSPGAKSKPNLDENLEQILKQKHFVDLFGVHAQDLTKIVAKVRETLSALNETDESKKTCIQALEALQKILMQVNARRDEFSQLLKNKLVDACKLRSEFTRYILQANCSRAIESAKKFKGIITTYFHFEPGNLKNFFEKIFLEIDIELARVSKQWLVDAEQEIDEVTTKANPRLVREFILESITDYLKHQEKPTDTTIESGKPPSNLIASTQKAASSSIQKTTQTTNKKPNLDSAKSIYLHTLYSSNRTMGENRWTNFVRKKINRKILSLEEKECILKLLANESSDESRTKIKHKLSQYLDGAIEFNLATISPYEHADAKVRDFLSFLKHECFILFPVLKGKTNKLLRLFKKANGIDASEARAESYPALFAKKVDNLSKGVVLKIQSLDQNGSSDFERDVLSIAAEFDIQDIGELAQLIPKRPHIWYRGRHILSTKHLKYISLLRKMMAHYPLMLSPEVMRWNLAYLSFETDTKLKGSSFKREATAEEVEFAAHDSLKRFRCPLTLERVNEKKFDIVDAFERVGFDPKKVEVLYPPLNNQPKTAACLNPLGDFVLMAHPYARMTDEEYVHALMELELILSYELEMNVKIVGKNNVQHLNINSHLNVGTVYLDLLLQNKQEFEYWIFSQETFQIYCDKPWFYVEFRDATRVSFADAVNCAALQVFLKLIGLESYSHQALDSPKKTVEKTIMNNLVEMSKNGKLVTRIVHFSHFLFSLFSPPGTNRKHTIVCPTKDGKPMPILSIDEHAHSLWILPMKQRQGMPKSTTHYYDHGMRLDNFRGRKILNYRRQKFKSYELKYLASYAAKVLLAHKVDLNKRVSPINELSPDVFTQAVGVCINDPVLTQSRELIQNISPAIGILIREEADILSMRVTHWLKCFTLDHGVKAARGILKLLIAQKKLEEILRNYYAENRILIKGPFMRMDEISKSYFGEKIDDKGYKWTELDFLSAFSKFYDLVENDLMENNDQYFDALIKKKSGQPFKVRQAFSEKVTKFIRDEKLLKQIFPICVEIAIHTNEFTHHGLHRTINTVRAAIRKKGLANPNNKRGREKFYTLVKTDLTKMGTLREKLHHLFRMFHTPRLFYSMLEQIEINVDANEHFTLNLETSDLLHKSLTASIVEEFEFQYRSSPFLGENTTAEFVDENGRLSCACLSDIRDDLENRAAVRKGQRSFECIKSDSAAAKTLGDRWHALYGSALGPQYYENALEQARILLNYVLNKKTCPSDDERDVSQNSAYWDLVEAHPVKMSSTYRQSALKMTFKHYILAEKLTFEDLIKNETLRKDFENQPKLRRLISAYIAFLPEEMKLSERHGYLTRKLKLYKETKQDFVDYIQSENTTEAQKQEFKRRLDVIRKEFERMFIKFKESVKEVKTMTFFNMLKLSVSLNYFVENNSQMTDTEEERGAFKLLLPEPVEIVYQDLGEIFTPALLALIS